MGTEPDMMEMEIELEHRLDREVRRLNAGMELCHGYLRTLARREMTLATIEKLEREYEAKLREIDREQ